ncbi:MAG: methyltransferase domain-containing protein [Paracoccaceae bacterium]
MQTPQPLTDLSALERNRARARPDAMFLHRAVIDDVHDRLMMVNRRFTKPAIVTPYPEIWRDALPDAVVITDSDTLTLEPGQHDLVIHALCLHWSNDPVGQMIQCRRALKPDGLMIAVLFGGQTLVELRAVLSEAEVASTGGLSPRIVPMGEIRDLGGLLQRAGFAMPVADSTLTKVIYQSTRHLMHDLRAMGESNALAARLRKPTRKSVFEKVARLYTQHFGDQEQNVPATFEMVCLTGWAPDSSQPQPLRPGSAKQRLADALAVTETKLSD